MRVGFYTIVSERIPVYRGVAGLVIGLSQVAPHPVKPENRLIVDEETSRALTNELTNRFSYLWKVKKRIERMARI